jgi:hypothetical protein
VQTKCCAPISAINRRRQSRPPTRRPQFHSNRPTIKQHKCNAVNHNRWFTRHMLICFIILRAVIIRRRVRKHRSELFRDFRKEVKNWNEIPNRYPWIQSKTRRSVDSSHLTKGPQISEHCLMNISERPEFLVFWSDKRFWSWIWDFRLYFSGICEILAANRYWPGLSQEYLREALVDCSLPGDSALVLNCTLGALGSSHFWGSGPKISWYVLHWPAVRLTWRFSSKFLGIVSWISPRPDAFLYLVLIWCSANSGEDFMLCSVIY